MACRKKWNAVVADKAYSASEKRAAKLAHSHRDHYKKSLINILITKI